ncbi:MAG: hypothetical protein ACRDPH_04640 [Marmoricola sp.]
MSEQSTGEPAGAPVLGGAEAERVRRRVRLLVEITSRVGVYRTGLKLAARRLTRPEATIIADLERHGLDVVQLREVLWGGHVLVDDPDLYARWRFPKTHERLSSHHKNIDKERYPDLGLKGPLVREKLHGRTAAGTWVQLEKTPAAIGDGFHLPTLNDLRHLCDYVVYRFTKSNVGPWGLSKQTERRPVYLSPALSATVPVPAAAERELTGALERVEDQDDTTSASPDLARRFPPPDRSNTLAELVFHPGARNGRGLFGSSEVYAKGAPSSAAHALVDQVRATSPGWSLPEPGHTAPATVRGGDREVRCAVRRVPVAEQQENI